MIPVIVIHLGSQPYYDRVIDQASKYNECVFAIGDSVPPSHYDIHDYSESANKFRDIYDHLSTNSKKIELMCFQRWFILKDFMEKHGIEVSFHIDSDVMLYANTDTEFPKFEQFDFTLSHRCCGSNSFFTLNGLKKFCGFLINFYMRKNTYEYERIAAHYHVRQKHGLPGGVCDMTLLEYYSYQNCGKIGEMMHIIEDSTYDHNINVPDQYFQMDNGTKNFVFVNGTPFVYQKSTGKQIQFKTLHFQGSAKNLILKMQGYQEFCNGN